jgi:hypothetical protein
MKPSHGKKPSTINITSPQQVHVRKSLSSPTNNKNNSPSIILPAVDRTSIIPSTTTNSELPKKDNILISLNSNKNQKIIRLNTSVDPTHYHLSSSSSILINQNHQQQQQHQRPNLRMSASSRFGKNLLPTWLGGQHSTEEYGGSSPTTSFHSNHSTSDTTDNLDSAELTNTFETLLVNVNTHNNLR